MKQGIQEFYRKYVLVPADKAANNVVVTCRLHYINTLKQELNGTKAYEETSSYEKTVVNSHSYEWPCNKNIKMSSFKSSENIQKKEGGPDRSVSDNQSSSVTLKEQAMKAKNNVL